MDRRSASARPTLVECFDDELDGGIGIDRPMRHEQRVGSGVEKRTSEAGECFCTRLVASAGSRVAGRDGHPIGMDDNSWDTWSG
jgi:hypothetical protein